MESNIHFVYKDGFLFNHMSSNTHTKRKKIAEDECNPCEIQESSNSNQQKPEFDGLTRDDITF